MKVLFITSSRIGDAVLSTGILNYIVQTYPDAKITIGCGPLVVSLFEGMDAAERIIPIKKQSMNKHWFAFWKEVVSVRWDIVIDLRDSAVSRLIRAKQRFIFSRNIDKTRHKAEQAAQLLKLTEVPAPRLFFSQQQKDKAAQLIPDGGKVLGVGPTANWIGKTWDAGNFIEVIKAFTAKDGILPDARVAVFAAPGEEEEARKVLSTVPEGRGIDVIAKTDPGTAAAALARCDFYIGNDSGLMHCAAAAGTPTFGVFGPSYPHLYRPWGNHCAYEQTEQSFDELTDFEGYDPKTLDHSLMFALKPDIVISSASKLWKKIEACESGKSCQHSK